MAWPVERNGIPATLKVATRKAGAKRLTNIETLDDEGSASSLQAATGADGTSAVIWTRKNSDGSRLLRLITMSAGSAKWNRPMAVVRLAGRTRFRQSKLWIHPDGDITIVWAEYESARSVPIKSKTWNASEGSWSPVTTASISSDGTDLSLTGDASGRITIGWRYLAGFMVSSLDVVSNTWTEPRDLGKGDWTFQVAPPKMLVKSNQQGDTIAVWEEYASGGSRIGRREVFVSTRLKDSDTWSQPTALLGSANPNSNLDPRVAEDADGGFMIAAGAPINSKFRRVVLLTGDSTGTNWHRSTLRKRSSSKEGFDLIGNGRGAALLLYTTQASDLWVRSRGRSSGSWAKPKRLGAQGIGLSAGNIYGGENYAGALISKNDQTIVAWSGDSYVEYATLSHRRR